MDGRLRLIGLSLLLTSLTLLCPCRTGSSEENQEAIDEDFPIGSHELNLDYALPPGERRLSFSTYEGSLEDWKNECREKLRELAAISACSTGQVIERRKVTVKNVTIHALVQTLDESLSIPAYLLMPDEPKERKAAVIAIHGHGEVEPCIGREDDYHHMFALEMARDGYIVLCPEMRGFGALRDLAAHSKDRRFEYETDNEDTTLSLVTDSFQRGETLIGQTVEDLLRWENWLTEAHGIETIDVAGISYGGDLALIYPVFSNRVRSIFASGTLGSFSVIFTRCFNAPAHCIPGILKWMDRSDIAGLNAPRPIALHYGELDVPGPENGSASYNETVPRSIEELKAIYKANGAGENVHFIVSRGMEHEMDIPALLEFLNQNRAD